MARKRTRKAARQRKTTDEILSRLDKELQTVVDATCAKIKALQGPRKLSLDTDCHGGLERA
jgi:hypothetical protein